MLPSMVSVRFAMTNIWVLGECVRWRSTAAQAICPDYLRRDSMVSAKMSDDNIVASLRRKLVNSETSLSQKYRVLFSLRNIPGPAAEQAIVEGQNATTTHIVQRSIRAV